MFLNRLTSKQQKVFLSLAIDMIHADKTLDAQEEAYLNAICNEMQLSRLAAEQVDLNQLPNIFADEVSKNILMIELTAVSHCDGNSAESEKNLLREVAQAISVSSAHMETCNSLVSEFFSFQQKFNQFIG